MASSSQFDRCRLEASATAAWPVLLVDDDRASLLALEAVLADLEIEIVSVDSGRAALRQMLDRDFALVVLDVGMPDLDGFAAAKLIRARPRSRATPIIFLTGRREDEALYRAYDLGAVDYLLKPVVPAVLRSKVLAFVELNRKTETIRRQVEALAAVRDQLERSQADLAQFASIAAHDLKEPLRTISSFLQLLAEHLGDGLDESSRRYLRFALDGARRLQALIEDLLAYARLGAAGPARDVVSLQAVLATVLSKMGAAIESSRAMISVGPLPEVSGSAGRLEQLMQNLLENALKFTPPGASPQVEIACRCEERTWHFWVRDHGIGFDGKHADRIFVPFQRLHTAAEYGGTGIGLALCKRIVELHGGRIWAEGTPGEGATIHFTLSKVEEEGNQAGLGQQPAQPET